MTTTIEGGLSPLEELIVAFNNNETHPMLWIHERLDKEQVGSELVKVPFEPVDTLGERIAEALAFGEVTTVWARARIPAGNNIHMAKRIRVAPLRPLAPPAAAAPGQRPPDRLERLEAAVERLTQAVAGSAAPSAPAPPPATPLAPPLASPPPPPAAPVLPPVASPLLNDAWSVVNGAFDLVGRVQKQLAPPTSATAPSVDVDKMVALAREAEAAKAAAEGKTTESYIPLVKDLGGKLFDKIGDALDLGKAYVKEVSSVDAQARLKRAERGDKEPETVDVETDDVEVKAGENGGAS